MQTPNLSFLSPQALETRIPIPSPQHLKNDLQPVPMVNKTTQELRKYEREFNEFCQWAALPKDLRKPKTAVAFEKKWALPKNYTTKFRMREEYQGKRVFYFYEWMMDLFPDVVYAMYKRALKDSSADARVLAELINKKMEVEKPRVNIAPMVIVGVDQSKIDKLFTPKEYIDAPLPTKVP